MYSYRSSPLPSQIQMRGERKPTTLLIILLLSLGLKLGVWAIVQSLDPARLMDPDSITYHEPARALLHTGAFVASPETPAAVETYRTPGYPLFLACLYLIFGENHAAAIPVQILLSIGTMGLVYWMARTLGGANIALLAVLLFAFDVSSFTYSLKLMSETLFTLLLTAMLAAGICLVKAPEQKRWAFLLGVLLTSATFVRPISYYLIVPLIWLLLWLSFNQKWDRRRTFRVLASIAVPFLVLVGGWQVRNYLLTGTAQFSSVEGANMLFHRGAKIVALQDDVSLQEARTQLWQESEPEDGQSQAPWSAATDERWKQQALRLILRNPISFVRTQIPGAVLLLTAPGEGPLLRMLGVPIGRVKSFSDYFKRFDTPVAVLAALLALLYLAIIYSGVLFWWWRRFTERQISHVDLLLWSVLFYFFAVSAGQGDSRFRVPIMPILVLYAARGLYPMLQRFLGK